MMDPTHLYDRLLSRAWCERLVGDLVERLASDAAMLSMIGLEHQFVLAGTGLPPPVRDEPLLPRAGSLCALVAATGQAVIIEDGTAGPGDRGHAARRFLGFQAYLGVPVRRREQVVAVLAVMSRRPRRWPPEALATMERHAAGLVASTATATTTAARDEASGFAA